MSIKDDLMYPFGNPLMETFTDTRLTALNNILTLAKERLWIAEGRPVGIQYNQFDDLLSLDDIETSRESVEIIEQLLTHINDRKNV